MEYFSLSPSSVSIADRHFLNGHSGGLLWFTGLSGSGKTTIAKELKKFFKSFVWIDGDNFRKNVSYDLKFSIQDRKENLRRAIGFCKLLNDQNINVIASFISPLHLIQKRVQEELTSILVYVQCPLKTCIKRDPKGFYLLAQQGKIKNFTGIDSIYQIPLNPDLKVQTDKQTVKESVLCIIKALNQKNLTLSL